MNASLLGQLQELNLSANEAAVYLALLEIGQTSAGVIIRKTGLHRSVVYETLDRLAGRKLVLKLEKQKVAHFQALDPERLVDNAKSTLEIAKGLVPDLKALATAKLPEITVYEGVEAYRRFWIESMQRMPEGSTDYVAGSIGAPWMELLGPAAKQYFRTAQERNVGWKMVIFDIDDAEQSFLMRYPDFRWESRLIDRQVSKEGNFNVLADQSVVLHSATEPMVIEVRNDSLVTVFRNLFDILWESGKPLS